MIKALFGSTTTPFVLRKGLDETMAAHKQVAERIAGALTSSGEVSTATGTGAGQALDESDLTGQMAALADTQLRYEAEARLLQVVYQGLRTSIHSNG
jgi:hypothetical protein